MDKIKHVREHNVVNCNEEKSGLLPDRGLCKYQNIMVRNTVPLEMKNNPYMYVICIFTFPPRNSALREGSKLGMHYIILFFSVSFRFRLGPVRRGVNGCGSERTCV